MQCRSSHYLHKTQTKQGSKHKSNKVFTTGFFVPNLGMNRNVFTSPLWDGAKEPCVLQISLVLLKSTQGPLLLVAQRLHTEKAHNEPPDGITKGEAPNSTANEAPSLPSSNRLSTPQLMNIQPTPKPNQRATHRQRHP